MNVEAAAQTAQEVGRGVAAIRTDVMDQASVDALVGETVRRFGSAAARSCTEADEPGPLGAPRTGGA
jgi:hypothetical protein